jgi:NADH-quinone oxidoreductase subunit M
VDDFKSIALFLTILLPAGAGGLLAFFPRSQTTAVKVFSAAVGLSTLVLTIVIFALYDYTAGGYQFNNSYRWLEEPLNIDFSLGIDGISAPMVLLTGIVMFAGILVSWNVERRTKDFFVLFMFLVSGVFGVFVVRDLFFLFFFYELAVLPMFPLIGVWGSSTDFGSFLRTKEYGAMKLTLYLVAGSVLVWVAILAVYVAARDFGTPTFSLEALSALSRDGAFSRDFQLLFFPLFMVGFGVLAGMWPFHTWSPDGHVAAPTAVSMIHAGVLMKLGAYGIIRVGMTLLPQGAEDWMPVLVGLGTVNVLYGALSAMGQRDLKYVVGYSSVSHMGLVLMGIATLHPLGVGGAVLQMFSHGIMTALFFAVVGFIYDRAHIRDITVLGGLAKRMGVTVSFFAVAGMASLGLPGLSGFVAEFLVFVGVFQEYLPLAILAVIGAAITAVYILRLLARAFFGPIDPRWEHLTDARPVEVAATSMLVLVLVFVGVWPLPMMNVIDSGVSELLTRFPGQ